MSVLQNDRVTEWEYVVLNFPPFNVNFDKFYVKAIHLLLYVYNFVKKIFSEL